MKSIIASIALLATTTASATWVDLETIINHMSKEDKQYFQKAVSLISTTENQDIKWKSKSDQWQFVTVFPRVEGGLVCKDYQLTFMSGGFSQGKVCEVSANSWKFIEGGL